MGRYTVDQAADGIELQQFCRRYRVIVDGFFMTDWISLREAWEYYQYKKKQGYDISVYIVHITGFVQCTTSHKKNSVIDLDSVLDYTRSID